MEKIYMENNNRKRKKFDGVTILSFFVAIVAIVSLIAVGFNQVSFSATSLPSGVTKFKGDAESDDTNIFLSNESFPVIKYTGKYCENGTTECSGSEKDIQVFCVQRDKDFGYESEYNKEETTDLSENTGFIFLISNLLGTGIEPIYNIGTANQGDNTGNKLETWVTQAAIWYYLNKINYAGNGETGAPISKIMTSNFIVYGPHRNDSIDTTTAPKVGYINKDHTLMDGFRVKGTDTTIEDLIDQAIELNTDNVDMESFLSLDVSEEGDVSISDDEAYYFSKKISVQGSSYANLSSYKGFSITLPEDLPEGTIITDENYKEMENLDNLVPGTKFYVRVPIDSVEEAVNINLDIKGNFDLATTNVFATGSDDQKVGLLDYDPYETDAFYNFELTPAPDTASNSNTAQTVCFIGLIVLLCGLGIVYANAKNAKVKE